MSIRACATALVLLLPAFANAQRAADKSCNVKASDPWVVRQAESFDDSKRDWSDDTLRLALLSAAGISSALVAPVQMGVEFVGREPKVGATAEPMRAWLKQQAAVRGSVWPTRSVVGGAGVHAVYLLVQSDTGLARAALKRMMEAGPTESIAADVATFEDRMRLVSGRKQLYGTQFRIDARGAVVLAPMEDSAHADLRREDAGLPPFALALCLAKR